MNNKLKFFLLRDWILQSWIFKVLTCLCIKINHLFIDLLCTRLSPGVAGEEGELGSLGTSQTWALLQPLIIKIKNETRPSQVYISSSQAEVISQVSVWLVGEWDMWLKFVVGIAGSEVIFSGSGGKAEKENSKSNKVQKPEWELCFGGGWGRDPTHSQSSCDIGIKSASQHAWVEAAFLTLYQLLFKVALSFWEHFSPCSSLFR